jgi:hypothetical protein
MASQGLHALGFQWRASADHCPIALTSNIAVHVSAHTTQLVYHGQHRWSCVCVYNSISLPWNKHALTRNDIAEHSITRSLISLTNALSTLLDACAHMHRLPV